MSTTNKKDKKQGKRVTDSSNTKIAKKAKKPVPEKNVKKEEKKSSKNKKFVVQESTDIKKSKQRRTKNEMEIVVSPLAASKQKKNTTKKKVTTASMVDSTTKPRGKQATTTKTKKRDVSSVSNSTKDTDEVDYGLDIDPNLLFLVNDNLSKSMDPYDRFNNNSSEKVIDPNTMSQKSKSTNIIIERGKQTIINLSHDKSHVYYNNDLAPSNARLHEILPSTIYPMQRFLENGFTPVDNMNPIATISCITRNLIEECDFIADQKKDDARKKVKLNDGTSTSVNNNKNNKESDDTTEGSKKVDLANTKLTQLWGEDQYHSFGYHRRRPKELQAKMDKAYQSEKLNIFKACYEYDCIEPDVNFGTMPSGMRMFTQIHDQFYHLYKIDDQIIFDSTAMTPKIGIEVLERNYLRKYRMKPEPNEKVELCSKGKECVFMVLIKAGHQGYVGRVFYTKNEIKSGIIHNTDKLCIDCLLKVWTRTHDLNIFHEIKVDKAMNHFSVKCEPGEYSKHCMLTVEENGRQTGIEKHVPRFSENMRHNVTIVNEYDEGRQLHTTYTPYLAEIGMDF